jgi:hypothetical protein
VTVFNGVSYPNVTTIYTTYGTLYSLEEILTEVVKVEWEWVEVPQAMQTEVFGGNGTQSIADCLKAIFSTLFKKSPCYVLYNPNLLGVDTGIEYAKGMRIQLIRAYWTYVELIPLSEEASFADIWADMNDSYTIPMVVLLGHGRHNLFETYRSYLDDGELDLEPDNHKKININYVRNLDNKNIETIFIAACNTTKIMDDEEDIASVFLQIPDVESVVAFDGYIHYLELKHGRTRFYCGYYTNEGKEDEEPEGEMESYSYPEGVMLLTVNENDEIEPELLFGIGSSNIFDIAALCNELKNRR